MERSRPLLSFDNDDIGSDSVRSHEKKKSAAAKKNGTIASSVFNLTNTILGSGTLAVAYTCKEGGYVSFVIIMAIMALMSHYAVVLIFETVELSKFKPGDTVTYGLLGKKLYGRTGELVAEWAVTLQQLGACVGYVVIIGDVLWPITGLATQVFAEWEWLTQLLVVMLIIFPICLLRNMDALKFTSLIAIICILLTALVLAVYGFDNNLNGGRYDVNVTDGECGTPHMFKANLSILSALPVFSFAFLCHQNTFPIYEELQDASIKRMSIISGLSMILAMCTYVLAGVGGYLAFADGTLDDILLNFNVSPGLSPTSTGHTGLDNGCLARGVMSFIADVVRVGFGIALIFSYVYQ